MAKVKAVKAVKVKVKIEDCDHECTNLGLYLRRTADCIDADATLADILSDFASCAELAQGLIDEFGDDAKLSDFDITL